MMKKFGQHHPVFGWWHLPNVRVLLPGKFGDKPRPWLLQTNSLGMAETRELTREQTQGTPRLLIFGDSFTAGVGVDITERYSNVMESLHPGLEAVNFGRMGSGPDVQYLVYRELGRHFEGDLLMINPHASNLDRVLHTSTHHRDGDGRLFLQPKPYYTLDDDGQIELQNVPVPDERVYEDGPGFDYQDSSRSLRSRFKLTPYKYRAVQVVKYQPFPQYDDPQSTPWRIMEQLLERWISERDGRRVALTPLPSWVHVMNPALANYIPRFKEVAARHDEVEFIDVLPHFVDLPAKRRIECFISPADGHYSPVGHRVVAEALLDEITKRSLVDLSGPAIDLTTPAPDIDLTGSDAPIDLRNVNARSNRP